jgi:SagB-type dehydrogenase family enzyme
LLHRLTSLAPGRDVFQPVDDDPRVRRDINANDPDTRPPQLKTYPASLPAITLPADLKTSADPPATAVLAGAALPPQPLDAAQLGRLLFLSAGIVRIAVDREVPMFFRASGSAGGRFPLELYASTRNVTGIPDGIHWYDAQNHALVQIAPAATGTVTTLIVTGVPWRTGWRYVERGWRHLYWDAGTMLSQLIAAADSAGLAPRLRTCFPDRAVAGLVGADGVHEFPLALLSLGDGQPAIGSTGQAATGELPQVEFPLVTMAQRAGDQNALSQPWPAGAPLPSHPSSGPLGEVILSRGSQRLMDSNKTLPRQACEWSMAAAMRGIEIPHWIAVHGVDETAPGLYRWPDLSHPLRAGNLREELYQAAILQGLAADAAFVAISAISATRLDDHSYREAQLAAGIVEGRLHLAAYALGAAAAGMTFYDSLMPSLLSEPSDLVTLLFTCVGVPEYKNRRGGGPRSPVPVKSVRPRLGDL